MKNRRHVWMGLVVGVTLGMGLNPVQFMPTFEEIALAQPPTLVASNAKGAAALKAYQEGLTLLRQGTATSSAQVLEKFEFALTLAREARNRQLEALILQGIGTVYFAQNDYQKSLAVQEQALVIQRELNNRLGQGALLPAIANVLFQLGKQAESVRAIHPSSHLTTG